MEAFIEGVLIQLMETSHPLSALMNYIDIVSVTCLLMERVMNYIGFSTMTVLPCPHRYTILCLKKVLILQHLQLFNGQQIFLMR